MMLNWSWSGKFLAINEAPWTRGSLSLRGFMFAASRRRRAVGARRWRGPRRHRRGTRDDARRHRGRDANECCTVETPRRYREMMEVSRRKDGAFDGRAKRPSRPNNPESCTCALYSVASAVEGRGARRKSQGRSFSSRTSTLLTKMYKFSFPRNSITLSTSCLTSAAEILLSWVKSRTINTTHIPHNRIVLQEVTREYLFNLRIILIVFSHFK